MANGESVTFTMTYDGRVKKHITSYGDATFLSSDDDWEFGDILKFNDGLVDKARLMFVTSRSTRVTVLTLDDHFDPAGTIQYYNRSALARAED